MPNRFFNRYVWVYVSIGDTIAQVNVNSFVSPDSDNEPFPTRPTPYTYTLVRNDVRYRVKSEVQLSQNLAIRIAGQMYDSEFILVPKINQNRKLANR